MADITQDFLVGRSRRDLAIEISVSDSCNKKCKYCFEQKSGCFSKKVVSYDEDLLLKLILGKCRDIEQGEYTGLRISFWGGEPFLNVGFVTRVIEHTCSYPFVRYHIYTNGTLADAIEGFSKTDSVANNASRISIQVSYDGDPHNELMRGYGYLEIERSVETIDKAGFFWSFKSTLSFDCIAHFEEMWDSFSVLHKKYPHIKFSPTIDTTECDIGRFEEFKTQLIRVAHKEIGFYKENGDFLLSWFTDRLHKTCDVNDHIYIDRDGYTYTCHGCPYLKDSDAFRGANIENVENLDECIGYGYNVRRPKDCVQCEAKYCAICFCTKADRKDVKGSWGAAAPKDGNLCKYYKFVGYITNILDYIMITEEI